jgi:type II secretory pathway pseudopilin PulG
MKQTMHEQSSKQRTTTRAAFTLIEMVTALAISTLIVAAMGSAVMVASAALPTAEIEQVRKTGLQLDWLMLEVSEADTIKAAAGSELAFTIPDRNGDDQPELITYTWDGNAGSSLYRTYNTAAPEAVASDIDSFVVSSTTSTYTLGVTPDIKRSRVDSVSISLLPTGAKRSLRRTIDLPNAPNMLDLWVRTDFDSDPTVIDNDYSGQPDWYISTYSGGTYSPADISQGWWKAKASLGVKSPGMINAPLSVATRVRLGSKDDQSIIQITIEVANFGAAMLRLTSTSKKSDIFVDLEELSGSNWTSLYSKNVPKDTIDIKIITEPNSNTVTLFVNGQILTVQNYSRQSFGVSGSVLFESSGPSVYYDWVDVRIGGTSP